MKYSKSLFPAIQIILLALLLALPVLSFAGATTVAVALTVKGDAQIQKVDGDWKDITFGTIIDHGDKIRTGEDGFVALAFTDDKSQIKIRPNTEITIQAERNDDFSLAKRIEMQLGELYANVKKQRGDLKIATPTSVASVKGTEFWVMVDENGFTRVLTLEGIVSLLSQLTGEAQDIVAGNIGSIGEGGTLEMDGYSVAEVPEFEGDVPTTQTIEIEVYDADSGTMKTITIELEGGD